MIPENKESHEHVAFECASRQNKSVRCVIAGKNMYSYIMEYTISADELNLIKESTLVARLNNVVNLVPRSCDIYEDFVVFLAENRSPISSKQKAGEGSYFKDKEVIIVYNLNYTSTVDVKVGEYKEYDLYKLLTQEDFATNQSIEFTRIHPHFVKASDNSTKLLVNIGTLDRSIRLFNLNGLSIIAPEGALNSIKSFEVQKLNGESSTVEFSTFLNLPGEKFKKKTRNAFLIVLLTICVVLVIVLVLAGQIGRAHV